MGGGKQTPPTNPIKVNTYLNTVLKQIKHQLPTQIQIKGIRGPEGIETLENHLDNLTKKFTKTQEILTTIIKLNNLAIEIIKNFNQHLAALKLLYLPNTAPHIYQLAKHQANNTLTQSKKLLENAEKHLQTLKQPENLKYINTINKILSNNLLILKQRIEQTKNFIKTLQNTLHQTNII